MRVATATASMVSAAVLLAPGCGSERQVSPSRDEPVRRATFHSLAARDFLATCAGGPDRPETARQDARFAELRQLAARKQAGRAVWLGENDWGAVERYSDREPCEPGEAAYGEALAAYSGALDALAARIAAFPPPPETPQ